MNSEVLGSPALGADLEPGATRLGGEIASALRPATIAIIGGSRRDRLGGRIVTNLIENGYAGEILVISSSTPETVDHVAVHDGRVRARWVESVEELFEPVDLVVVSVPPAVLPDVLGSLADRARSVLIISSLDDSVDADAVRAACAALMEHGVAVIGPNSAGLYEDTTGPVTFSKAFAVENMPSSWSSSRSYVVSQSGAFGVRVVSGALLRGVGVAGFVSVGNEFGHTVGSVIRDLAEGSADPDLFIVYLENLRGMDELLVAVAGVTARGVPVVVLNTGRSAVGARAAATHTGALTTSAAVVANALTAAGASVVDSDAALMDVTHAAALAPPRRGERIGVITGSGGFGVLCADLLHAHGLVVPELSPGLQAKLREFLPSFADVLNPVDMSGQSAVVQNALERTLRCLVESGEVDGVIVMSGSPASKVDTSLLHEIPVLFVELDSSTDLIADYSRGGRAVFNTMESACRAMRLWSVVSPFTPRAPKASALPRASRAGASVGEAMELATKQLGIEFPAWQVVDSPASARAFGEAVGWPIVLKGDVDSATHKVASGLLRLGVTADDVDGWFDVVAAHGAGVVAMRQAPRANEWLVSFTWREPFGWVVTLGVGGSLVEVADRVVAIPVSLVDDRLIELVVAVEPRLASGSFGKELPTVCARVVQMIDGLDRLEFTTAEFNPCIVAGDHLLALDARLTTD